MDTPFGRLLKQRRKALDLTQDALARLVGCAVITIQKIEAGALRPSKQIAERLADQLGLAPEEHAAFVAAARADPRAGAPTVPQSVEASAARQSPPLRARGLPVPSTTLVGRTPHVQAVRDLLMRDDVRLVTLLGPPGVGKTRLSLQVAAELRGVFADGVCFVALVPLRDPGLVVSTIAHALGVIEAASGARAKALEERLKEELCDQQLLLVLDNFEQVTAAAPLIAELLGAAPGLKALVTSREVLRLSGEHEFTVPPLALPAPQHLPSLEALAQYAAVELFVQRAQAVRPGFSLNSANAAAVAAICAHLDGLPLAIELAAVRIKLFTPGALLAQLDHRLALLTGGARDLPARQQTLRNAIDWSYHLLDEAEQSLFARLGVFVGGWTLEAAQAVVGGPWLVVDDQQVASSGDEYQPFVAIQEPTANSQHRLTTVLDVLQSLVDKSLIQRMPDTAGEPRFVMLETLREYALERLLARGEADAIQRWHARYFLRLAEEADAQLFGIGLGSTLLRLEADHDNLRAALAWSLATKTPVDVMSGVQLAGALALFWHFRGYWSEGRAWLARALAHPVARDPTPERAKALYAAGFLAWAQEDYTMAQVMLEESLAICRRGEDRRSLASTLGALGLVRLYQADCMRAVPLFTESLQLFRDIGDSAGTAVTLIRLGLTDGVSGNWEQAAPRFVESLALGRELGHTWVVATSLSNLGFVALHQRDWARAHTLFKESIALYQELGATWYIAASLGGLAAAAIGQGQTEWAARLLGAVDAALNTLGRSLDAVDRAIYEPILASGRAQMGEARFAAASAEGQAMTLEQAIAYALEGGEQSSTMWSSPDNPNH